MNEEQIQEQLQQEYDQAPPDRLMEDSEFDPIHLMDAQSIVSLPDDTRRRFFSTAKYHAWKRQEIDEETIDAMVVGGRTGADIIKSLPAEQSSPDESPT